MSASVNQMDSVMAGTVRDGGSRVANDSILVESMCSHACRRHAARIDQASGRRLRTRPGAMLDAFRRLPWHLRDVRGGTP